ncbi:MAG: acylphosphatase [Actinobacteria bacterium]|nr:acylphosphatase [Actinomycetota bacterium]
MALKRAHILIEGRVQGVFFRASMKEEAERYGIKGWVRNLPGGDVEALIEGENAAVDELIKWCWQGPPGAMIDHITVEWEPPKGEFESFLIKR